MLPGKESEKLFREFSPVPTSQWEEKIRKDLKGADYEKKLVWKTDEGFDVRPYYRKEDITDPAIAGALPDHPPYTRGVRKDHNDWIIRQDLVCQDPVQANKAALDAIAKGVNAIGFCAKDITTHKQISQLLCGIDLTGRSIHFTSSRSYPLTLELFIYEINNRELDGKKVTGSLNFDPVSYLLLYGDFYISWKNNIEEAEYLLKTARKKVPKIRILTVNGHYFRNSGSTIVQELAFSLASANEYLAGLTDRGLTVDAITPQIQFTFATGSDYFLEIAKLRAARRLWSQLVELYHPEKKDAGKMFIHSVTSTWNKTVFDPYVNMLRTTVEGMAAAIGNSDSIAILPFDFVYKKENGFSSRIARNQQLILKEESYLNKIVDPSAGSYYIEKLTDSIAVHAWNLFRKIEEKGGALECIKSGFIQDEIEKINLKKQADLAKRKMIMIGTNQYPDLAETMLPSIDLKESPELKSSQVRYKTLKPSRGSESFEKLRLATETFTRNGKPPPKVFLFTFGSPAMRRVRADFAANFFGCAGYPVIDNPGFRYPEKGIKAALNSGSSIVVLCSSNDEYTTMAPVITESIKKQNPSVKIIVAGYPENIIEQLKAAGVDDFIHIRSDVLEVLTKYHEEFSITKNSKVK